jgi:hypothetical protein
VEQLDRGNVDEAVVSTDTDTSANIAWTLETKSSGMGSKVIVDRTGL